MPRFEFDQKQFMDEVFAFIKKNKITIRAFCMMASCSLPTLYRARDLADTAPMELTTIRKFQEVMDTYSGRGN